jgi:hypothetical protein
MRDRVNESFVRIVFSVPLAEMSSAMDMLYCNQVTAVTILRCFYRGIIRVIHFFPIVYARLTVSRLKFADSTTRCRSWLNRRILAARRSNERKQREKMDYPYNIPGLKGMVVAMATICPDMLIHGIMFTMQLKIKTVISLKPCNFSPSVVEANLAFP